MEITGSKPPSRRVSGYKETVVTWSLNGDHVYYNNNLKTNESIDRALTELFADGAVERMGK